MSNPTELPDLDRLEALARAAANLHQSVTDYKLAGLEFEQAIRRVEPQAFIDLIALARRAQPEGEAPQAELVADANRYVYLASTADWSAIEDLLSRSDAESATELKRDLDKLIDTRLKSAITLPLYAAPAAQHAESGAPAVLDEAAIVQLFQRVQGRYSTFGGPLNAIVKFAREVECAALAAQSQGAQAAGYITEDAAGMLKAGRGVPVNVTMRSTGPWHVPIYFAAQQAAAPGALPDLLPPLGIRNDRDMLNYLMTAFDNEIATCERCGHAEPTKNMDSASFLRDYLTAAPSAPGTPEAPIVADWKPCNPVCDESPDMKNANCACDAAKTSICRQRAAQLDGGQGEGK